MEIGQRALLSVMEVPKPEPDNVTALLLLMVAIVKETIPKVKNVTNNLAQVILLQNLTVQNYYKYNIFV